MARQKGVTRNISSRAAVPFLPRRFLLGPVMVLRLAIAATVIVVVAYADDRVGSFVGVLRTDVRAESGDILAI